MISEEIARISRAVIHPKFRGIGLGAYLVKEIMPKVNAKVIETMAAMAKYNPFFEKAGMIRVDYKRDETSIEKRMRDFLTAHGFDFDFLRSEIYCLGFFSKLSVQDRERLLNLISEFANQPFIKNDRIRPRLLTKALSADCFYLYWVNIARMV